MSELSDWKRIVLPSELAAARAEGKAEGIAEVNKALSTAQQKIAELEAALANLQLRYECNTAIMHARTKALTAVRQRCEEAEAAVRPFNDALQAAYANGVLSPDDKSEDRIYVGHSLLRAALAHFTRYPTASDSEERGG